jgi:ferredoxin
MKVAVDLSKCQGYANCVIEAPDVFDLDEETGKATVLADEVPPASADDARRAAGCCPVRAITVLE